MKKRYETLKIEIIPCVLNVIAMSIGEGDNRIPDDIFSNG